MEWLSQNWVWLAFATGMLLMMRRGGAGGCCGGAHGADRKDPALDAPASTKVAGGCCRGGADSAGDQHADGSRAAAAGGCCGGSHGSDQPSTGAGADAGGGCCGGQGQGDGGTQGGPGREHQPAAAADQRHEPALRP